MANGRSLIKQVTAQQELTEDRRAHSSVVPAKGDRARIFIHQPRRVSSGELQPEGAVGRGLLILPQFLPATCEQRALQLLEKAPAPSSRDAGADSWNGLRHLGDSGNGGTTLEFLWPFLWRALPLEMRRERQEFFPDHPGKGSLLSRYEAETGLLWMWVGPSCFISSGDGYVGDLLDLQQGCQRPFGSSRG